MSDAGKENVGMCLGADKERMGAYKKKLIQIEQPREGATLL